MKVAIIAPPYPLAEAPAPPLGVGYVAAAFLAAGAEVRIFDYIVRRYTREKLQGEIDAFQPDVVGATSVTLNFPTTAEILVEAKKHRPKVVTVTSCLFHGSSYTACISRNRSDRHGRGRGDDRRPGECRF